ncbi:MAG: glycoside hydrolase family 31 protein [Bacteroidota bacterium]|nr:glycoside hydrolase family 31 protein [Bacteroidota bacterium]
MTLRIIVLSAVGFISVSAQTFLGNFSKYTADKKSVVVHSDSSAVRLQFYSNEIVRVDFLPTPKTQIDSSFVVIQEPSNNVQFIVTESDSALKVVTSHIQVRFQKFPLRISFLDSLGNTLVSEPRSGGLSTNNQSRVLRFTMNAHDHYYGTGERCMALDKRGQKFVSYNTQVGNYTVPLATMNLNVPFIATSSGYAIYIDNTYRGTFDFGTVDTSVFSYVADGGELSLYVIVASTIPEQLEKYTWLTGRQPLPPRWVFGFIQSKNRYENETITRSIVQTMREKNIPCDGIVLDLKWFDKMGDVSWNESLWPTHEKMVTDFLSEGIKTILITEPYIIQPSKNFTEADTNGYLAKDSTGKTYLMDKWWSCGYTCGSTLLDITNPAARKWWWSKHPVSFGKYVAGIWTDLGEPERHPEEMNHYLGNTAKIHNIYNLLWAKTIYDGFTELRPNERVVNVSRSGFAGSQRYGVMPWSGDVARSFIGLQVQMPILLGMGMSGIAYQNSDIGGYARMPTTPELYIRWMEFGTFCPITRAHGAGETVNGYPTEPWMFGAEAEKICREFISLRYQLLPYIYSLAHNNYETGMPFARPLFWLDPNDKQLGNESSSYMWGDAFLVSPVVTAGERTKNVYLPKGTWVNFWTDEIVQGGKTVSVAAPLERMPIFVKEGSIIPMAPLMNYSDERILDTLTLRIYPSFDKEVTYSMYEDDGKTREYQSGKYSKTTFTQRVTKVNGAQMLILTGGESQGTFTGKLNERNYIYEIHGIAKKPMKVQVNGFAIIESKKLTNSIPAQQEFSYDGKTKKLFVHIHSQLNTATEIQVKLGKSEK